MLWLGGTVFATLVGGALFYLFWSEHFSRRNKKPLPPELSDDESRETEQKKPDKVRFELPRRPTSGFKW